MIRRISSKESFAAASMVSSCTSVSAGLVDSRRLRAIAAAIRIPDSVGLSSSCRSLSIRVARAEEAPVCVGQVAAEPLCFEGGGKSDIKWLRS